MPRFYKILIISAFVAVSGFFTFIFWIQLSRQKIEESEHIPIVNPQEKPIQKGEVLKLMLWNISYGGMPTEMDFFYSGGTQLMISQERYLENFVELKRQIKAASDSLDIILLHKVDTSSKRSYYHNQVAQFQKSLFEFESSYCLNYSVPYIPVPLDKPLGEIYSGMMTLSRYYSEKTSRIPLTQKTYNWPKKLFTAQKCISLTSFPVGHNFLHIINAHLNSYDFQGEIRMAQLQKIWEIADSLENRGDYVIAAGGWNMNPPGFKKFRIKSGYRAKPTYPEIDSSRYFNGWKFDYRMDIPTSRSLREGYRHGAISTSIKDFFICSPNIGILEVNTTNQQFKNSDHHAVFLKVYLIP